MPFPILRTPFVVLSEIISLLEPNEISLASNGHVTEFSTDCLTLYFENRVLGSKTIVDYVADLFNLDVHELAIDRNNTWAIDWINEWQEKTLVFFEFMENSDFNGNDDEALDYALRNTRASEYCILENNASENFRFNGELGPVNHLLIDPYGHWVTLNNLINSDAISIVVRQCRLSIPNLYSFIRHWRTGGSPRLTFMILEFENQPTFEHFVDELDVLETDISGEYRLRDGDNWDFENGCSIQRNDGVKAVIEFGDEHFAMMVCIGEHLYDRDNYLKKNSDQQFVLHQNV
ncbi:hypothetical protein B9Z55_015855 [Caenorhabditis nigoni]|uniref:Sdz-33 F-box domain-containing protein n=1 Tax=Caenorhabditis nigoni TaxID=1611254 RepID=A0A2G5UC59_9PELO|nr:hypothetical protein B9Z55_015855 [Caenorhabditis nigoni]